VINHSFLPCPSGRDSCAAKSGETTCSRPRQEHDGPDDLDLAIRRAQAAWEWKRERRAIRNPRHFSELPDGDDDGE